MRISSPLLKHDGTSGFSAAVGHMYVRRMIMQSLPTDDYAFFIDQMKHSKPLQHCLRLCTTLYLAIQTSPTNVPVL